MRLRAIMGLASQETARTNAAEASARLRRRRHERDEVDAYLSALDSPTAPDIVPELARREARP